MPSRSLSVEATLDADEPASVDTTLDADEPASVVATLDAVESTVAGGTECEGESTCEGEYAVSDGESAPLSRDCALGIAGNAVRSSGAGALSEPAGPEPAACVRSAVPAPESHLLCGPSPPVAARAFLPAAWPRPEPWGRSTRALPATPPPNTDSGKRRSGLSCGVLACPPTFPCQRVIYGPEAQRMSEGRLRFTKNVGGAAAF